MMGSSLFTCLVAATLVAGCGATSQRSDAPNSEPLHVWGECARDELVPHLQPLVDAVARHRVVAIGERHHRSEHTELLLALLRRLPCETQGYWIALEIPRSRQADVDAFFAGRELSPSALVYSDGLAQVLSWLRAEAPRGCFRVACIDRPEPVRSDAEQTRDQAMFAAVRSLLVADSSATVLAYLGAGHVLENVEARDAVAARDGSTFEVPVVPFAELLSRWGIEPYSVLLGTNDEQVTDPFEAALARDGAASAGVLELSETVFGEQRGFVRLGSWYRAAEQAPIGTIVDALVYFPQTTRKATQPLSAKQEQQPRNAAHEDGNRQSDPTRHP